MTVGLLAGLLVVATTGFVSAQSPSPSPGMALQRVEVPEARIALELPESWVVDVEMHELTPVDLGNNMGELIGTSVLQAHSPTPPARCGLLTHELSPFALYFLPLPDYVDLFVDIFMETFIVEEADRYSSNELALPAGDAMKVAYDGRSEAGPPLEVVHHFIAGADRYVMFFCVAAPSVTPSDDWLSIAEAIELEAGLPGTPPDMAESLVRLEVPEAGIALNLPESWTVEVEMLELSREPLSGGELTTTAILQAGSRTQPIGSGLYMQKLPPSGVLLIPDFLDFWVERNMAGDGFFLDEVDDHTLSHLDLPAGDAISVVYEGRIGGVPITFVQYFIAADDGGYVLFFRTTPPLAPDDDWLSIAETFEFLPAEE